MAAMPAFMAGMRQQVQVHIIAGGSVGHSAQSESQLENGEGGGGAASSCKRLGGGTVERQR